MTWCQWSLCGLAVVVVIAGGIILTTTPTLKMIYTVLESVSPAIYNMASSAIQTITSNATLVMELGVAAAGGAVVTNTFYSPLLKGKDKAIANNTSTIAALKKDLEENRKELEGIATQLQAATNNNNFLQASLKQRKKELEETKKSKDDLLLRMQNSTSEERFGRLQSENTPANEGGIESPSNETITENDDAEFASRASENNMTRPAKSGRGNKSQENLTNLTPTKK